MGSSIERRYLASLRQAVARAKATAPFYSYLPDTLPSMEAFGRLRTVSEADLAGGYEPFLSVGPQYAERVVSLPTSGTEGAPKRIAFDEGDIKAAVEYFQSGMHWMAGRGRRILTLLPGTSPNGVASLLVAAARELGMESVSFFSSSAQEMADCAREFAPSLIISFPVPMLRMAYITGGAFAGLENILLTGDYAAPSLREKLASLTGAGVFSYYGSTEMCFGGARECPHGRLHPQKAIYFEALDDYGDPLPEGEEGELCFTSLGERAMPFIRYWTGDMAAVFYGRCECGEDVALSAPQRMANCFAGPSGPMSLGELDDAFFAFPGLLDWQLSIAGGKFSAEFWLEGKQAEAVESLRLAARERLGQDAAVSFADPGSISPGMRGKRSVAHRPFV